MWIWRFLGCCPGGSWLLVQDYLLESQTLCAICTDSRWFNFEAPISHSLPGCFWWQIHLAVFGWWCLATGTCAAFFLICLQNIWYFTFPPRFNLICKLCNNPNAQILRRKGSERNSKISRINIPPTSSSPFCTSCAWNPIFHDKTTLPLAGISYTSTAGSSWGTLGRTFWG